MRNGKQRTEEIAFPINGINIQNIRYADDTMLITGSKDDLQQLEVLKEENEKTGLKINLKKTKTLVFSKKKISPECKIHLDGKEIEQVGNSKYLGSILTQDCKCSSEIRKRIAMAKAAFTDLSNILINKMLHINSKKRLMKCHIWSVFTYGCESWTLANPDIKCLEAMGMWIYRRIKRRSWMERASNVEILDPVNEKRTLIKTIRQRQLKFIGHIMREDSIKKLCVQGFIEGRRSRGKQRTVFLQSLTLTVGFGVEELCRLAKDRDGFRDMVANVRL